MLREKGKKKKKRKKESWNVVEFGGSGRLQKRKEVEKEKCKGTCVKEKKKGKKEKKCGTCVEDKKRGKKKEKKKKEKEMVSQYFHNTFIINFKW